MSLRSGYVSIHPDALIWPSATELLRKCSSHSTIGLQYPAWARWSIRSPAPQHKRSHHSSRQHRSTRYDSHSLRCRRPHPSLHQLRHRLQCRCQHLTHPNSHYTDRMMSSLAYMCCVSKKSHSMSRNLNRSNFDLCLKQVWTQKELWLFFA